MASNKAVLHVETVRLKGQVHCHSEFVTCSHL
jgi:hypothetical protein